MYLIMIVMTGAAVAKGMFGRHKKRQMALVTVVGLFPLVYVLIAACLNVNSFRVQRILAFFNWSQYQHEEGYLYKVIHDILNQTKFVGGGSLEFLKQYPIETMFISMGFLLDFC